MTKTKWVYIFLMLTALVLATLGTIALRRHQKSTAASKASSPAAKDAPVMAAQDAPAPSVSKAVQKKRDSVGAAQAVQAQATSPHTVTRPTSAGADSQTAAPRSPSSELSTASPSDSTQPAMAPHEDAVHALTVDELLGVYDANKSRADVASKGKTVYVRGLVDHVGKNNVSLNASSSRHTLKCKFADVRPDIQQGSEITLQCTVKGKSWTGQVSAEGCTLAPAR